MRFVFNVSGLTAIAFFLNVDLKTNVVSVCDACNEAKVDDQYEWTGFVTVLIMTVEFLWDRMVVEDRVMFTTIIVP